MTLIEACLLSLALTMIAMAGTLLVVVIQLRATTSLLAELIKDTRGSVRSIDELGTELKSLVHRANVDYRDVSDTARRVADTVIQPAKGMFSMLVGLRAAAGFFLRPRPAVSVSKHNRAPFERS